MTGSSAGGHDDRAALVRLWLDRSGPASTVPPATATPLRRRGEAQLIAIWQDVLEREGIGTDDDYFALGGDSIAAVAVVSRARAAGMPMTTHDLFELRTVGALVDALGPLGAPAAGEAGTVSGASVPPGARRREELTPLQRGILFDSLADPAGRTQLVQIGAQLDGDVDIEQFTAACRTVFGRHRGLRGSVGWDATGSWLEFADGDVPVPVRVVDLRGLPPQHQTVALETETERDFAEGIDLRAAPLLRVTLVRLGDGSLRFLLTHHHLVLDGWSQQLVLRELLDLYDGVDEADLPDPNDGISEHRRWLAAHDIDAGLTRWRQLLSHTGSPLVAGILVPGDRPTYDRALTVHAGLPDLVAAARQHQVTPATIVYAAWSVVVAELTGADDVVVGVTLSGRPATLPRAEGAVGMFIATLPLRTRPSGHESFRNWARRVQSDRAELEELQHCPLSDISRSIGRGPTDGAPLFDTIVVVENFPEAVVEGTQSRRLRVTGLSGTVWEGYPLVLEVRVGQPATVLLRADAATVPEWRLHAIRAALSSTLVRIAARPTPTVADLRTVASVELAAAVARRRAPPGSARRQPAPAPMLEDSPIAHPDAES